MEGGGGLVRWRLDSITNLRISNNPIFWCIVIRDWREFDSLNREMNVLILLLFEKKKERRRKRKTYPLWLVFVHDRFREIYTNNYSFKWLNFRNSVSNSVQNQRNNWEYFQERFDRSISSNYRFFFVFQIKRLRKIIFNKSRRKEF